MIDSLDRTIIRHLGKPVAAPGGGFSAVFDHAMCDGKLGDTPKIHTVPVLYAVTSDIAAVGLARRDAIIVDGQSFRVANIVRDNFGLTTIHLTNADNGSDWYGDTEDA